MYFASLSASSTQAVTILTCGYASYMARRPSGHDTRLRKMMRSCGTPWSIRTSMALIAEPPVAVGRVLCVSRRSDEGYAPAKDGRAEEESAPTHRAWGRAGGSTGRRCPRGAWRRRAWRAQSPRRAGSGSCLSGRRCERESVGGEVSKVLSDTHSRQARRARRAADRGSMSARPKTHRQHSRRPASMLSPARMIDTPQILPSNPTPLYSRPARDGSKLG